MIYLYAETLEEKVKKRILIVEDDRSFGMLLQKWFERNGFGVSLCTGMVAARENLLQNSTFKLVLADLRLPDGDGILLLNWINEQRLDVPVIIMSGYGEISTAVSAIKLGAVDFLEKPINPDILKSKIESVFENAPNRIPAKAKKLVHGAKDEVPRQFVEGGSPFARQMYSYIGLVAPTQMAVMINGESGTGKEHVARLIHLRSHRADGPFIAVDCGSLSTELAPSELFGHKKGSFTSAIEDKTGFFREAHGGTLFLDEVGNLPYGVQMQLLRSLQEKKVRPVGIATDLPVDVRIIAATNENLEEAIAKGTLREDLYHRLNEFMIRVPALRDCAEDIPAYARHFMEEANLELDREARSISPEALAMLMRYSWPGNLRELRNVIRRSVLFTKGDTITAEGLPQLADKKSAPDIVAPVDNPLYLSPDNEKARILQALEQTNGNKTKAARLLQIDRKTLYNKMHQYQIDF